MPYELRLASVTPRDRRSRRLPCFFFIFVCLYLFVAFIIALHPHVFIKLASAHSCRAPLLSLTVSRPTTLATLLLVFSLVFSGAFCQTLCLVDPSKTTPRARPKIVPNPTRVVVTDGSGSSPNIRNSSSISHWTLLRYLFSTVRLRSEGRYTPKSNPPTIYI